MNLSITPTFSQTLAGIGLADCGTWTKARGEKKAQYLEAWVNGFLTAINVTKGQEVRRNLLAGLKSGEQAYLWVDKYCKENPLGTVASGSMDLLIELTKK